MAQKVWWAHGRRTTETSSFRQIKHSLLPLTRRDDPCFRFEAVCGCELVSLVVLFVSVSSEVNAFDDWLTISPVPATALRRAYSSSSLWTSSLWRWKSSSIFCRSASCFLLISSSAASFALLSSSTFPIACSLALISFFHFAYMSSEIGHYKKIKADASTAKIKCERDHQLS